MKFGTSEDLSKVYAEKILVSEELPLVNNINLNEIMAKAVFKSIITELGTITAQKTFTKPLTLGNATLEGTVFGIEVSKRLCQKRHSRGHLSPKFCLLLIAIGNRLVNVSQMFFVF